MIPSPVPYNLRWTAKLIHRDVKSLAAKYTAKLKSKFTSKDTQVSAPLHEQLIIDDTTDGPGEPEYDVESSEADDSSSGSESSSIVATEAAKVSESCDNL